MMRYNIETAVINSTEIAVDVAQLEIERIFFNAKDMALPFAKRPDDFWKQKQNQEYLDALITLNGGNKDTYIKTRRGRRYGGTWLHQDLGLAFARWLSPLFAVRLDIWTKERIKKETTYREKRLAAKTGYLPMTKAVADAHDNLKPYHFSNEVNLLYKIVLDMTAKEYRESHGVVSVRDHLSPEVLDQLNDLQVINTGLIKMGLLFQMRKEWLQAHHEGRNVINLLQVNG